MPGLRLPRPSAKQSRFEQVAAWLKCNARWRMLALSALLMLVTLAVFWPVHRYDFVRYDDPLYVTENPHVLTGLTPDNVRWAFRSGHASNWHPVTWISHMVDVELFGMDAGKHHLVSVAFHIANSILLFLLLQWLTGTLWRSFAVAALFALHPMHIESVAWISERKDVLSTFFLLLTVLAYARYVALRKTAAPVPISHSRQTTAWYALALLSLALGLMSKPMLVTVPFLLLLLDYWPLRRFENGIEPRRVIGGLLLEKLPFFGLALLSSVITYVVQEKAHSVTLVLPLASRLANAIASYAKYLAKAVWPADLAIFYPHPDALYPVSSQWPLWALALVAVMLGGASLLIFAKARIVPWFATGWFWFLGTLIPVIGIVQVGSQAMANRYTYIPYIGLFICMVWGIHELLARVRIARFAAPLLLSLALIGCAVASRHELNYWRDDLTLFSRALAVTERNSIAHTQVGLAYGRRGDYERAIQHFEAAIAAVPNTPEAYSGLGYTYELQARPQDAVAMYRTALQLRPWDSYAHFRMGSVLERLGEDDSALSHYEQAVRHQPGFVDAHIALGLALTRRDDLDRAVPHLTYALKLAPENRAALRTLAEVLFRQGNPETETRFRQLVRLDPGDPEAHLNLGSVLWLKGKAEQALEHFAEAVRLDPNHPTARYNYGTALHGHGDFERAAEEFARATELRPDYTQALTSWGRALAAQGKLTEAIQRFEEALKVRPDAFTLMELGSALANQGKLVEAMASFREALELRPGWPPALRELAWFMATSPKPELRDGTEAVRLAEQALGAAPDDLRILAVLDAAYAEAGRFPEAIKAAEKVVENAAAMDEPEFAAAAEQRLKLYREGKPYRVETMK